MPNLAKPAFLEELAKRNIRLTKLNSSKSLYEVHGTSIRLYFRYSKIHRGDRAFYGLRKEDLRELQGYASLICFLWDEQVEPLLLPFANYEDIFQVVHPASDGQYKVQVLFQRGAVELYIPSAGRFNVEGDIGWHSLDNMLATSRNEPVPTLTHHYVQSLLGAIGTAKNHDIWIPLVDRSRLDTNLAKNFRWYPSMPIYLQQVSGVLEQIDVLWFERGSNQIQALFEVENSTTIYSGLLRFNDVFLSVSDMKPRFSIVADDTRRTEFIRQVERQTFKASGLSGLCNFMEYENVWHWFRRTVR